MTADRQKKQVSLLPFAVSGRVEVGVDEAGRGCLAGPVVAAAVVFPPEVTSQDLPGLNDSKKLTARQREALRPLVISKASAWGIAEASPAEIDELNILGATFLAMHRAIEKVTAQLRVDHLLIDGNRFRPQTEIPYTCVVGGDGKFMSIAAASILAKTERDAIMKRLDAEYPAYGWAKSKGYPTRDHYAAIAEHGETLYHRRSFCLRK